MKIIGIDPGIARTGYACLEYTQNKIFILEIGVVKTNPKTSIANRIKVIHNDIAEVIAIHNPDIFAIETVFVGKNIQSTLKLGQARAAAILAAALRDIKVVEFSPRSVKQHITGTGKASKEQVQYMVKNILKIQDNIQPNDAADAVAVALSGLQSSKVKVNL